MDVILELGQVTETVNVTAEAALLETQTASRVGVVNTTQVAELPLNSRNPFMLGSMMGGNNIAYVPIVDAVQEFSVQQNSYNAQCGKTGSGVFNVVLKGGSNDFHATGWEFARRKWLDANTFQNNSVGADRPGLHAWAAEARWPREAVLSGQL